MSMDLRWICSLSASCLHVADMVRRRRSLNDAESVAALVEPAAHLQNEITAAGLPEDLFWRHLMPQSARIESNRELAETVLRKVIGAGARVGAVAPRLAGRIGELEAAVLRAAEGWVDDVAARASFMQEQWTLHGGNLLTAIGRLTDERLIVPSAEVVVVFPATGGAGAAHLLYNSVTIEAVSADPVDGLPEVVRMAWLLSQLNVDLPMFSENIHRDRRPLVAALSMLAATLAAAEQIELIRDGPQIVETAVERWHVEGPAGVALAEVTRRWWQTYLDARPPWNVALAALDKMIAS